MNTKSAVIVGIVVLAIIGSVVYTNSQKETPEKMMEKTPVAEITAMMEKPTDAMMKKESRYVEYTKTAFDAAKGKKRVYFFHASWCPTCKAANTEITGNLDGIPEDVVLFKTDYDTNSALKKQYSITYQHTFVLVDDMGKELKKWNGGGLAELSANTK